MPTAAKIVPGSKTKNQSHNANQYPGPKALRNTRHEITYIGAQYQHKTASPEFDWWLTRFPPCENHPRVNTSRRTTLICTLAIAVATFAVYANALRTPFIFDDVSSIVNNATIRTLWPPLDVLSPPTGWGFTVSGRPILNLSLALNYAVSGLDVWSYHVGNVLIHVLAALTLFGIVRRTLRQPVLAGRFSSHADLLALVIAGIWALHPLQTEAVTYLVQRAESLMGLFFFLTLYAFIRTIDSSRPRIWQVLAVAACLLGVGTKEVAALAPVIVLLYDRTFVSGSFVSAWKRHRGMLLALAATWLPQAWLVAQVGGNRGDTMGFDVGVSPIDFWLTQFEAVTRYLGLAFWPHPLVFDYGKIPAGSFLPTLLWAIPVLALIAATVVALVRWPAAGFLGAWFLSILAPTSVVPSLVQVVVEHRMYLPLAAVVAFVLAVTTLWFGRRGIIAVGGALALATGFATVHRNTIYQHEQTLWEDTLAKRPDNARAHNNLGGLLNNQGRFDEAIEHYRVSLRGDSTIANTHYNLGLALMNSGRPDEAIAPFIEAVSILPNYFNAHLYLGIILSEAGRTDEALPHFAEAIRFDPAPAIPHFHRGVALAGLGRWEEAIGDYEAALQINPNHAPAHSNWGVALFQLNSAPPAIEHFNAALRLDPALPGVHFNLGLALSSQGRRTEAILAYTEAVRLIPDFAEGHLNLGIALSQSGDISSALDHLQAAVDLRPDSADAHSNLAFVLAQTGRMLDARSHFETALDLRPDDANTHFNLGHALIALGETQNARDHFEAALALQPDFAAAQEMLRQLAGPSSRP